MALKLKEITCTAKATVNLGDYSNLVFEVTLTAESDSTNVSSDTAFLQSLAHEALTDQVLGAVENRLIAGIPALNGKQGALRRQALEAQPCVKVLATLDPNSAKEVVDKVLELSLAPERKVEPNSIKSAGLRAAYEVANKSGGAVDNFINEIED